MYNVCYGKLTLISQIKHLLHKKRMWWEFCKKNSWKILCLW